VSELAQPEQQQRAPGGFGFDMLKGERRLAGGILDGQPADPESRMQPAPLGRQAGYFHRQADGPRQNLLHLAPVGRHIGQNPMAQAKDQQAADEIRHHPQPHQPAQAETRQVKERKTPLSHARGGAWPQQYSWQQRPGRDAFGIRLDENQSNRHNSGRT